MNSAKKLMQRGSEGKKKSSPAMPDPGMLRSSGGGSDKKPIILGAACVIIVLVLCIGVGVQQLKPQRVMTIKDEKISMDDMMYPIYEQESKYLPMNEMYESYMGTSVWDAAYQGEDASVAAGTSNSDGIKQEVLNKETEYEVLYQEAKAADYALDDDEKAKIEKQVDDALKGLSFLQKFQLRISKKKLAARFEKRALADKYKEERQKELNADVDEDAAIADISKKDYRQYDIEYYYVSLNTTDSNGNTTEISKSDRKELAAQIRALARKAARAKDFSKLIKDEENSDIQYNSDHFIEKGGWQFVSDANLKKIKALKNGEISDVFIDDSAGYYVFVKMIDNNSTESYQTECDNAIEAAQEEKYQEWYNGVRKEYGVTVNNDIWNEVSIGTVTTDIVTAEDLAAMAEDASSGSSGE